MVRKFLTLCMAGLMGISLLTTPVMAQDAPAAAETEVAAQSEEVGGHQMFKQRFIEGDPIWMAPVLICMILGLAIVIERIIYLNMASTNTTKFLSSVEEALKSGGIDGAKEVCRNTRGPIAGIFYQGLDRVHEGVDMAEKSIVAYGGVDVGRLERGLPWISLFIALAPMLGFLGTVVGMIFAFDQIAAANNISPAIVASGIKVALLTTVFGLIVAIILQVFYNYLMSKIDSITGQMEEASITLVDMLVKRNLSKH
jgi:biopolymer transport protein ExbB